MRMSHDEERASDAGLRQKCDRAPRYWLDPIVKSLTHVLNAFLLDRPM